MPVIYPVSDVHFRNHQDAKDWALEHVPAEADIVAIAGDIANGAKQGVKYMRTVCEALEDKQIVMILGNHDYWNDICMFSTRTQYRRLEEELTNFHFLNGTPKIILGVQFIGDTLWTDMGLLDDTYTATQVYNNEWPDCRNINYDFPDLGFAPHDYIEEFKYQLSELMKHVANAEVEGVPYYVMTHHLPDPESLDKRFAADNAMNPFYASKGILENMGGGGVWHHGHTHARCDYFKHGWRVICNPRGYMIERFSTEEGIRNSLANEKLLITIGD